jgi:serine/threonine-protein kinase
MSYEPGDSVADYQILSILGAGGMGKVYKVRNKISDRVEAMKVLLPNLAENADLGERFMREIKLQASLSHPNIATLHTALSQDNQLLMLVEFVEGTALDAVIRSGPLRQHDAINYMAQVLDALSYAHSKGVIHRDLKPANLMLTPAGEIKLLDFGIAKMAADRSLTQTGFLVGSLPYISPEQIEGAHDIDGRTDIYSLGITLYQALTGQVPFQAESEYSLMRKHLQEQPVPPMQVMPGVAQALNDVVLRSLEKDRTRRYQSAAEMAAALRALLAPPQSVPKSAPPPAAHAAPPPLPPSAPAALPYSVPPPQFEAQSYIPEARKPSNRGLYIAIGSVLTIIVLVIAATQLPKYFGAGAASPAQTDAAQSGQPAVQPPAEPQTSTPPVETPPSTLQPAPQSPVTPPSAPVSAAAQPSTKSRSAPPSDSRPTPQQTTTAAPVQPPPQQSPAPAPSTPAQPAPDASKLSDMREQLMLLGTRVSAVQGSLNRLKQEQARQGLGLRGDIAASAQRMEYYMDESESALKRGDAAAARKNLDAAERETSKLETFLGR